MYINGEYFDLWMKRLSKKLNEIGKGLKSLTHTNEVFENGEKPLDNQDLYMMLHNSSCYL
jgi:hypothetical protein